MDTGESVLGTLLKYFRARSKLTQEGLAHKIGRQSRASIQAWENGTYSPSSRKTILDLANVLQLSEQETDQLLLAAHFSPEFHQFNNPQLKDIPASSEQHHDTRINSAHVVSSGSGNIFIEGSFVPIPTFPTNGSNLPHRHPQVVGRREQIQEVLEALTSRAWIVTIDGMGGIGKTTLALEVAHICRESSADYLTIPKFTGYIWTSARDKPNFCLNDVIREILHVLISPTTSHSLDQAGQLHLAKRMLSSEPRLLIIDNFESVEDELLHVFLRDLPDPSKVLITSRHHIQTGEKVVRLDGLDEENAVKLLRFEASRLQLSLRDEDIPLLRIIAKLSHGIPFVLRWVMEKVYSGMSLDWVLNSLEEARANDIFDYIFNLSLSQLDSQTRIVFDSMALLPAWSKIETIIAMNYGVAAIPERISDLVKYCLVEDNHRLIQSNRRYRLHPFTWYLANKEFIDKGDMHNRVVKNALSYYLKYLVTFKTESREISADLEMDLINVDSLIRFAATLGQASLLDQCLQIVEILQPLDHNKAQTFLSHVTEPLHKVNDPDLVLKLLKLIQKEERLTQQREIQSVYTGAIEFLALEPSNLTSIPVVVQALDNQWLPRTLLRRIMRGDITFDDAKGYLERLVRSEYIRALLNSRQVVIPVAYLYNNYVLYRDYLPGHRSRDAFKKLLNEGVIVPFLISEKSPSDSPPFSIVSEGFQAWKQLCEEVRMPCLKLSWDEKNNWQLVRKLVTERFHKFAASVASADLDTYIQDFGLDGSAKDALRKCLIEIGQMCLEFSLQDRLVTREQLYKAFVTADGTPPAERRYDITKPFAGELKQLFDLAYNSYVADALGSYVMTPVDSLSRTALQEWQPTSRQEQVSVSVDALEVMLKSTAFSLLQPELILKSMNLLTLQDVLDIRATDEWVVYIESLEDLLRQPLSFDLRAVKVYQTHAELMRVMTDLVAQRHPSEKSQLLATWTPTVELILDAGPSKISVIWTGEGRTCTLSGDDNLLNASVSITACFNIRSPENFRNQDFGTSITFMKAKLLGGRTQWKELQRFVKEILRGVEPQIHIEEQVDLPTVSTGYIELEY